MKPSFTSGFASDITGMMEWRCVLGYTESCYAQEMKAFDIYCKEYFPEAGTLTWEIAMSHLEYMRERKDVRLNVVALRNLGKNQIMIGKNACVFPANYFSYKKRSLPYIMSDEEINHFFEATDHYPQDNHNPLLTYTVALFSGFSILRECVHRKHACLCARILILSMTRFILPILRDTRTGVLQ